MLYCIRTKHTYLYVDGLLMYEKRGDKELYFWYDGNGHLAAIRYYYNTAGDYVNLYALTNSMGDVLALYGGSGALLVTYEYDAWGNLVYMNDTTALGSGAANPIRYRGYYYDTDTGLYYCQSRYYDPQVGRWLNADKYLYTGTGVLGYNIFVYCDNCPITFSDALGSRPILSTSIQNTTPLQRHQAFNYMNKRTGKHGNHIDVTTKFDKFMKKNAKKLRQIKKSKGFTAAAIYFYENVTDGGSLDIKSKSEWKFEDGKHYYYRGVELRYDDLGNINFGYVGAVLFTQTTLCMGAGANQIKKYGFKFGNLATFYDDPRDNIMIKYGYQLFKRG